MEDSYVFSRIAEAMLIDYSSIYYVNAVTRRYKWFSINTGFKALKIEPEGDDFFKNVPRDAEYVVYPEDKQLVIDFLSEENLLKGLRTGELKEITYRLVMDGKPVYHTMRLIKGVGEDSDYFIVGVLNVDEKVRKEQEAKRVEEEKRVYNQIADSLASHYDTIYYVDMDTDHYIEFSATDRYKSMGIPVEGEDFFTESRNNIERVVFPADKQKVIDAHYKDKVLESLKTNTTYTMVYRLMVGNEIIHVRYSRIWAKDRKHIIIGVENINDEVEKEKSLRDAERRSVVYSQVAQSLAEHYDTIYYVDIKTDKYMEFTSDEMYRKLEIPVSGDDFFYEAQKNARRIIHPDDREKMYKLFNKDLLLGELTKGFIQNVDYRLIMPDGRIRYTRLSIVMSNDKTHIIMGVENVDDEVKREIKQKALVEESLTYNQIAISLANRYDAIYYVDMNSLAYTEYTCSTGDKNLDVLKKGDDFFEDFEEELRTKVVPEDRNVVSMSLDRNRLLEMKYTDEILQFTFRLLRGGAPVYMNYRAVWAADGKHLIIGITNVDSQKRKEREFLQAIRSATEMAEKDGLTGVKNMTAYQKMEDTLQSGINSGDQEPFAIVVCDVNGLKEVNDTYGHKAGDDHIRNACDLVCKAFQHSPVFRIGGDEFCAVLRGGDFDNRDALLEDLREQMNNNIKSGDVVIASGMSAYDAGNDKLVSQVFKRADNLMYENKRKLKGNG